MPPLLSGVSARPEPPPGPYLVVGLARAGASAVEALRRLPDPVAAYDLVPWRGSREVARAVAAAGGRAQVGPDPDPELLLDADPAPRTVVKSPGVPPSAPPVAAALARGLTVVDELELGWRLDARPLVAVTGTNGKSTVCALLVELLARAGLEPLLAGNTTLGPPLTGAVGLAGDVVVAEVSSSQLEGCPALLPDVAVFTGLSADHQRRHRSVAAYAAAKRRLFLRGDRPVAAAAVRVDDVHGRRLARDLRAAGSTVRTFGGRAADLVVEGSQWDGRRARVVLRSSAAGRVVLDTPLAGAHNAINLAAAAATAELLELPPMSIERAARGVAPVPGRLEPIDAGQPFEALVDYAHNPDGVGCALAACRARVGPGGRLIVVMSTPVNHGREQRRMGQLAAKLSDRLVLTTERFQPDAATAPPRPLVAGAAGDDATVIVGRKAAIEHGVRLATRAGDVVVVLGRGAAGGVLYEGDDGEPLAFDDRAVLRRAIELR